MKKYVLAAASYRFWIIFLPVDSVVWIFAIGGTRVDPPQWSSNVLLRYRGWGASEVSNIFTQGGLIIKNIPPNLSQSWPLILQSIFHKDRNERK